jgi:hypothetical protein
MFKLCIRKLPARNYGQEELAEALMRVYTKLKVDPSVVESEQFMPGKVSRKQGPQPGTAFLCMSSEEALHKLVAGVGTSEPFLTVEQALTDHEPTLAPAHYQRAYRLDEEERRDATENTYLTDPEWLEFQASLEAPVKKRTSAEAVFEEREKKQESEKEAKIMAMARDLEARFKVESARLCSKLSKKGDTKARTAVLQRLKDRCVTCGEPRTHEPLVWVSVLLLPFHSYFPH